jgi:hypothetical protein
MAHRHAASFHQGTLRVSEWVLGVVGVIGVFLGLFILFAGDDQYVGLGGEASWRVGDIAPALAYGLLGAGIALVLAAGALVRRDRHAGVTRAGASRTGRADLFVHATVFVLVNAFLWIQDFAIGGGLNYAYWVTIPWGIGLALHAVTVFTEERRQASGR